jgi:hypothetical protein
MLQMTPHLQCDFYKPPLSLGLGSVNCFLCLLHFQSVLHINIFLHGKDKNKPSQFSLPSRTLLVPVPRSELPLSFLSQHCESRLPTGSPLVSCHSLNFSNQCSDPTTLRHYCPKSSVTSHGLNPSGSGTWWPCTILSKAFPDSPSPCPCFSGYHRARSSGLSSPLLLPSPVWEQPMCAILCLQHSPPPTFPRKAAVWVHFRSLSEPRTQTRQVESLMTRLQGSSVGTAGVSEGSVTHGASGEQRDL